MRRNSSALAVVLATGLALSACKSEGSPDASGAGAAKTAPGATAAEPTSAGAAATVTAATRLPTSRKVIRNASLELEVDSPASAQTQTTQIVEQLGGYVASSERTVSGDDGERRVASVALTLRVPSDRLGEALTRLKRLGRGAETERLGSEDVTDEIVDLEVCVANLKRLETQLGTLLERTTSVEQALQVHKELATTRTEIDRLETRRQFLGRETELAKISLTLTALRPVVGITGGEFRVNVRRAAADSISVGSSLIVGSIRLLGVMVPLAVLLGLPAWLIAKVVRKRREARPAQA